MGLRLGPVSGLVPSNFRMFLPRGVTVAWRHVSLHIPAQCVPHHKLQELRPSEGLILVL